MYGICNKMIKLASELASEGQSTHWPVGGTVSCQGRRRRRRCWRRGLIVLPWQRCDVTSLYRPPFLYAQPLIWKIALSSSQPYHRRKAYPTCLEIWIQLLSVKLFCISLGWQHSNSIIAERSSKINPCRRNKGKKVTAERRRRFRLGH